MTVTQRPVKTQTGQLPVPVKVWEEIVAILAKGQNGQITLHFRDGKISEIADIYVRVRPERD